MTEEIINQNNTTAEAAENNATAPATTATARTGYERDCAWYFGPQAKGNVKGPNNPTALRFKGTRHSSLIRESIQNSMDAVADASKPVRVVITAGAITPVNYPHFYGLLDHIGGCIDSWPNNENAERTYTPMLRYMENHPNEMPYIRVQDFNTKGMPYDPNDSKSPFNAFISEGIAVKQDKGSGGSFGFGKAVFWMYSKISTAFVSTRTLEDKVYFEGLTKLCTHKVEGSDQYLSPNGLYDTEGKGDVVDVEDNIPKDFRTATPGTSVFIMGEELTEDTSKELIKSVLRNFWMAIYRGKLEVEIGDFAISAANLDTIMKTYFESVSLADTGKRKNTAWENHAYNPRPFYEIVATAEAGTDPTYVKQIVPVEIDEHTKWDMELYLHLVTDARGHFLYMRSPLMTVKCERQAGCNGAEGVLVCTDQGTFATDTDNGNEFLRKTEDYAHDSWSKENYIANEYPEPREAQKKLNLVYDAIEEKVKELVGSGGQEVAQMVGLSDLLYIQTPDDMSEHNEDSDIIDPTTFREEPRQKPAPKPAPNPVVRKPKQTKAVNDLNGRMKSNRGGKRRRRKIIVGPIKIGDMKNSFTEDLKGKKGIYAMPVDVEYRSWTEKINDQVWHVVRIFAPEQIDKALIQVYGVGEDGSVRGLDIQEVSPGYEVRCGEEFTDSDNDGAVTQLNNAVYGVNIRPGVPATFKVRFNSSIKYAIRINTDKLTDEE